MSYTPSDTIKDAEVYRELQRVGEEFEALPRLKILHVEPVKPRDGNYCVCDGVNWNPFGDGIKRPIWYDATTASWKSFNDFSL
jgi:hypothetical protein